MRVGIIHNYQLSGSGSCVYARQLARFLREAGQEVFLFSREQKPEDFDFIDEAWRNPSDREMQSVFDRGRRSEGLCVSVTYENVFLCAAYLRFLEPLALFFERMTLAQISVYVTQMKARIQRWVRHFKIDVLIVNHAIFLPYICSELEVPYITVIHGTALQVVERNLHFLDYLKAGLRRSQEVVVLNRSVRARVEYLLCPDMPDNIVEIPGGVDDSSFCILESDSGVFEEYDIDPGVTLLTFHGQLLKGKGVDLLIASMPLLLKHRDNIHLLIMGDGPFKDVLQRLVMLLSERNVREIKILAKENGLVRLFRQFVEIDWDDYFAKADLLIERIIFAGYVTQARLAQILSHSQMAIIPSLDSEAFPLVMVEALACGVVTVASYHSGLEDILDKVERVAGPSVKVERITVSMIAQSVIGTLRLLNNLSRPLDKDSFRFRLRDLVCRRYTWEIVVGQFLQVLEEILGVQETALNFKKTVD